MEKMTNLEMMNVNAGANYEETCPTCGLVIGTTYWSWSWLSTNIAHIVVGSKMREHKMSCGIDI